MDSKEDKKRFSILARINSATHAWRGLGLVLKTSHNMWAGICTSLLAIYLGFILNISPEFHPYAKDTKDVAAGAVLLSAILSVIVALFIFAPKILLYANIYKYLWTIM